MERRAIILFFALTLLSGCALLQPNLKEKSVELFKELNALVLYFGDESQKAEEENNEERLAELASAEKELLKSCETLQKVGLKKIIGEIIDFVLKLATASSLPSCEEKIHEMQSRFPEYKPIPASRGGVSG